MSIIKTIFLTIQTASLAFGMMAGAQAQTQNCKAMAEMAKDIANIRDMGVPLSAVEERLRRDVKDQDELVMALVAAKLVYKTRGTGAQLQREILKKC